MIVSARRTARRSSVVARLLVFTLIGPGLAMVIVAAGMPFLLPPVADTVSSLGYALMVLLFMSGKAHVIGFNPALVTGLVDLALAEMDVRRPSIACAAAAGSLSLSSLATFIFTTPTAPGIGMFVFLAGAATGLICSLIAARFDPRQLASDGRDGIDKGTDSA